MTPQELKNAYKTFFIDSEAGKDFMKRAGLKTDSNLSKAIDDNSLDFLARYKGNRELLEIIEQTLGGSFKKQSFIQSSEQELSSTNKNPSPF